MAENPKYATRKTSNSISKPGKYANQEKSGNRSPKNLNPKTTGETSEGSTKVSRMYSPAEEE